ncbi:hypothetical protein Ddye_020107 [Dipteronia dyeriana]|uniref:BSD domain-containing protein n=1 Tax=Dipteronia dyeriana TaxID=168575 RepID=A0AAD9WWC8_9ROSI|nr:hypothetical protein Ddye_020107 [Dipteronia dyeriana]
MSWLFKSLQSNDSDSSPPDNSPTDRNPAGVKDDLSVIGATIGRQLRGVAAFLAPPPNTGQEPQPPQFDSSSSSSSQSQALLGIRNDLVEIGGSFKSGLSILSSNKAVTGISKFASNLLQFQDQEDDRDGDFDEVPGITEEVVEFVKEISQRPACWTDFPLSLANDFEMSNAQREHTTTIERLVPSFMDLRIKLRSYLGDSQFWMIYFILLLPRLDEQDFDLLSTAKIIETRNVLLQKLQNKKDEQVETSNTPIASSQEGKEVTKIVNATQGLESDAEKENTEQWLEEEDTDTVIPVNSQKTIAHEEDDVSFSDLEDDDIDLPRRSAEDNKTTSPSGSNDWVKLNEGSVNHVDKDKARQSVSRDKDSEGESSDWLAVDEFD